MHISRITITILFGSSLYNLKFLKITTMDANEIIKLFINEQIIFEDILTKKFECQYGIQLVEKSKSRFDTRHKHSNSEWFLNKELGWGGSLKYDFPNRWDITIDASIVCYRSNFVEYIFFDIIVLSKEEQNNIIKEKNKDEIDALETTRIVELLTQILIRQHPNLEKINSGYLETNYGIHLKQIQRNEHRYMRYKPNSGNENWVGNRSLSWGSDPGWDITTDGKIACCRIGYDDYVNFEIQMLKKDVM